MDFLLVICNILKCVRKGVGLLLFSRRTVGVSRVQSLAALRPFCVREVISGLVSTQCVMHLEVMLIRHLQLEPCAKSHQSPNAIHLICLRIEDELLMPMA